MKTAQFLQSRQKSSSARSIVLLTSTWDSSGKVCKKPGTPCIRHLPEEPPRATLASMCHYPATDRARKKRDMVLSGNQRSSLSESGSKFETFVLEIFVLIRVQALGNLIILFSGPLVEHGDP
jgi:hypothetical protein